MAGSNLNPGAASWPVGGARAKSANVSIQTKTDDTQSANVVRVSSVRVVPAKPFGPIVDDQILREQEVLVKEVARLKDEGQAEQKKQWKSFQTDTSVHNHKGVNNLIKRNNEHWLGVINKLSKQIEKRPLNGVSIGLGSLGY